MRNQLFAAALVLAAGTVMAPSAEAGFGDSNWTFNASCTNNGQPFNFVACVKFTESINEVVWTRTFGTFSGTYTEIDLIIVQFVSIDLTPTDPADANINAIGILGLFGFGSSQDTVGNLCSYVCFPSGGCSPARDADGSAAATGE